ncbi:hypothetical protein [Bacillus toyonensis]|uniref:hypothetical protein n=1 Tax=Bacillus toyonensis TaxID=155322 RepID=UPI003F657351
MTENIKRNRNGGYANQSWNAMKQAGNNATNQGDTDVGEAVGTVGGGAAGAMVGSAFGPLGTVAGGLAGGALGNQVDERTGGNNNTGTKP